MGTSRLAKRPACSRSLVCEFQFDPLAETRLEFQCLDTSAKLVRRIGYPNASLALAKLDRLAVAISQTLDRLSIYFSVATK